MTLELINTGSELMLGRVLNTHQQWLCRQLADLGYVVNRQVAVADTADDIERAVRETLGRADFIITTGGLGPTSDDITRDRIAALLGRKLHEDPAIVAHVEGFFAKRNRPMPASTRVQAMVPDGALVLDNAHGTAPGLALHVSPNPFRADGKPSWLVMLPGPPRELRPMFTNQVAPLLKEKLPLDADFVCRTLRTVGIGESYLEERIAGPLKPLTDAGLELGYCAHSGAVDVRFVARGCGADADVAEAARIVHSLAGEHIFGEGDDELEQVLVRRLTERKQTLALAESCTGGFIANRITNVPGASAVLLAGLVTYSNAAKQSFLGVKAETLAAHGAVSEAVAREMAEGCRARIGADFGIGVTGIAGPGGGTQEKPVGTVFIALASAAGTKVINPVNRYDRETFKHLTCLQALELLRRALPASP
jgi:nicotinamide-nucleotide amidase